VRWPELSTTSRSIERAGVDGERRDDAKTISEMTNPIAPAIIKMTPTVDSRKPCCCTAAELGAVIAQYMMAPVTVDIALKTIPGKPMTSPLML
jgi:hypothetical protein